MTNQTENTYIAQIKDIDSEIANVVKARLSDDRTSDKAARLLVAFVHSVERSSVEIDASSARLNVYAVEKINRIMQAIATENLSMIDDYTLALMINARSSKFAQFSSIEQQATMSSEIASDDINKTLRFRRTKGSSTASTQASSTRAALAALKIVTENARDSIAFNVESEESHVVKFFAMIRDKKFTSDMIKR